MVVKLDLRKFRDGDPTEVHAVRKRARRSVRRRCKTASQIEAATQETIVLLLELDAGPDLACAQQVVDVCATKAARRERRAREVADWVPMDPARHADPQAIGSEAYRQTADVQALQTALASYTEEVQQMLCLRFGEQRTHAEIARVVGRPEATTRSILHRASEDLRAKLRGRLNYEAAQHGRHRGSLRGARR